MKKPRRKKHESNELDQFDLPTQIRIVSRQMVTYVGSEGEEYLIDCEQRRRNQEEMAVVELDRMAIEMAAREADRKRLWGKKFPRVLGQKPDEPINPVKSGKNLVKQGPRKRARTNLGG